MTEYKPEDYVKYRFGRAMETIEEVKTHIDNKFWNTAINRLYYACFYAVGPLLVQHKIEASTHTGIRQKFGEHFVRTGKVERELAKHSQNYLKNDTKVTIMTFMTMTKIQF
jgi:uncharacterized protein (UPF0332 family)